MAAMVSHYDRSEDVLAHVRWRAPDDGGRRVGPPPGPVYAATAVRVEGGEADAWRTPVSAAHSSVKLEYASPLRGLEVDAFIEFFVRPPGRDGLCEGDLFFIMEGRRPVALATIAAESKGGTGRRGSRG